MLSNCSSNLFFVLRVRRLVSQHSSPIWFQDYCFTIRCPMCDYMSHAANLNLTGSRRNTIWAYMFPWTELLSSKPRQILLWHFWPILRQCKHLCNRPRKRGKIWLRQRPQFSRSLMCLIEIPAIGAAFTSPTQGFAFRIEVFVIFHDSLWYMYIYIYIFIYLFLCCFIPIWGSRLRVMICSRFFRPMPPQSRNQSWVLCHGHLRSN